MDLHNKQECCCTLAVIMSPHLRGGGHIVFGADPVGFGVGVGICVGVSIGVGITLTLY